jgi:ribose/xylose/arabinose/galactoside ABC-type transport system permease subunit
MTTVQPQPLPEFGIDRPTSRKYKLLHGPLFRFGMSFLLLVLFGLFLAVAYHEDSVGKLFARVASEVLRNGIVYCLLALGASLVIATSEIDLSSLGVATLSGIIFALVSSWFHNAPVGLVVTVSLLCVFLFCIGSSLFVSFCVSVIHAPPLIFTWALGSLYILSSILLTRFASARVVSSTASVRLQWRIPAEAWDLHGVAFDLSILLVLFTILFLSGVNLPSRAAAIGGNADSARYAGVSKESVLRSVFMANSLLAGIAGVIQALQYGGATTKDLDISINGLVPVAIAVIGGTSLFGGYLSLWSVVFAAFFWSATALLGPLLPRYLPFLDALQAEVGQAVFYLVFVLVALAFGRTLSPPASKIYASKEAE